MPSSGEKKLKPRFMDNYHINNGGEMITYRPGGIFSNPRIPFTVRHNFLYAEGQGNEAFCWVCSLLLWTLVYTLITIMYAENYPFFIVGEVQITSE